VVELKQDGICLATVNTWVALQVLENTFNDLRFNSAAPTCNVLNVPRLISFVPVSLYDSLAFFTLRSQAVGTGNIVIKILHAFQGGAGRTSLSSRQGKVPPSKK
jgi:hypothetical protein